MAENNSDNMPIDIWVFADGMERSACSKRLALYLVNKAKAIVLQAEMESKVGFASQDDIHEVLEYVFSEARQHFVVVRGDDGNGNEYKFLEFDSLPEDFDIFVTNFDKK